MKIKSPYFLAYLAIVLYSISLLIYGTFKFFFGEDANSVSAFGSVMGGVGAFFAGFIAIYLFNDWRIEKNYELKKEAALNLLKDILNINSTIESLLAIMFEFRQLNSDDEYKQFEKWCNDLSKEYLDTMINLKKSNNLYHGLVLDFEKDNKLVSKEDMEIIYEIFNIIASNAKTICCNYRDKTSHPLDAVDTNDYANIINSKIRTLNIVCKPFTEKTKVSL
ncbi:hypothetical protein [Acinetobacter baumannii]|uniref:hypothetical protein n=1 Tax=Acinetobacter baumannii TaxID=470 RepID=UPI00338D7961